MTIRIVDLRNGLYYRVRGILEAAVMVTIIIIPLLSHTNVIVLFGS